MFERTTALLRDDGTQLALRHQPAVADVRPRAILVLLHGLAEHSGRYARFADFMAQRGFQVYAHDHRGHGMTQAPDAPLGRFATHDGGLRVVEDVLVVIETARERHPALPVFLFGHSMGGLIAWNTVLAAPPGQVRAVAVWNANFADMVTTGFARSVLKAERALLGSDVPSRIMPKLTFDAWARAVDNRQSEFDWLSHDSEQVRRYCEDPLCGFAISVALWQDVFRWMQEGRDRAKIVDLDPALPVHLVGGGKDPATDNGKAVARFARVLRRSGLRDVTGRIYPALRHETLNERDPHAKGAMEDFSTWADRVLTVARPA